VIEFLIKRTVWQHMLSVDFVVYRDVCMGTSSVWHREEHGRAAACLICCSVTKKQQIDVLIKDDQESDREIAVHLEIGHNAV
jgi:hypothetical protein